MAQVVCTNPTCRTLLMYPRGAAQVQCSVCSQLTCAAASNQVGHLVCGSCRITLMYAYGAQSVKCAVCNFVTPTANGLPAASSAASSSGPPPGWQAARPNQTVVVENPPDVDEEGNEVQNIAVGVTAPPAQRT